MLELPSGGGGETALYPLQTHEPYVTNGNHINITVSANSSRNLTDYSKGSTINSQPTWFTVPAGSTGVLKIKNINLTQGTYAFNFKLANSSTSASWGTGNTSSESDIEVSYTPSSDTNIGCLFVFAQRGNSLKIECDIEFYVDGVRYI